MAPTSDQRPGLDGWSTRLQSSSLPVFSRTVREVSGIATRRESSAGDLADAIGRDASLAARLLKIANSPMFNLQNRTIDTISSAVVLIGFDSIRELAVSLALIERVLKGRRHTRVTSGLSRAFHAAAQARAFAVGRKDPCPEEVFVAALLRHIGELAFWSVADQEAEAIERMTRSGSSLADAEARVLGFHLDDLTRRLVQQWHLGALLERTVAGSDDPRVASVELGHDVAAAVEQFGWGSSEVRHVVDRVATHLGVRRPEATKLVEASAEQAAAIAARYGVPAVESYLLENEVSAPRPGPDAAVQLETLKRIADHLEGNVDLAEVVRLVLTGIHEGVGLDRTFFARLSDDGATLQVRHALGGCETGVIRLQSSAARDLFRAALESGKLVRVNDDNRAAMQALITPEIERRVATPFVIMPVRAGERAAGLLYADNGTGGRPIDEDALSGFRHFGQQIALALASQRT